MVKLNAQLKEHVQMLNDKQMSMIIANNLNLHQFDIGRPLNEETTEQQQRVGTLSLRRMLSICCPCPGKARNGKAVQCHLAVK